MKRLPPSSLPRRVRKFCRNSQSQKIIAELLRKSKAFCKSINQWLRTRIQWLRKKVDYKMILAMLLLLILIIFPLTSWPFLANAISDADPDSLKSWGFYLLGAGIAPLGLYLTYNRTQSLRMQTDTNIFTKSIKLLGDPNPVVRQGGIYSLGGIARDNTKLHSTIMKIMASYIRGETYHKFHERLDKGALTGENKNLANGPMPLDIEAAIAVIRERQIGNDEPLKGSGKFKFDLSNSYVFNADLSFTNFFKINFSDSIMLKCSSDETNLSNSFFVNSILKNCEFTETNFQGCDFKRCDLSGSTFEKCDLTNVNSLTQEQINKANKVDEATKLPREIKRPKGTTATGNSTT